MRAEVRNDNIRVSVICAGLTDTHFNNSEQGTKPHYLSPFEVADTILYVLNSPSNVMIDEITLHPKTQVY